MHFRLYYFVSFVHSYVSLASLFFFFVRFIFFTSSLYHSCLMLPQLILQSHAHNFYMLPFTPGRICRKFIQSINARTMTMTAMAAIAASTATIVQRRFRHWRSAYQEKRIEEWSKPNGKWINRRINEKTTKQNKRISGIEWSEVKKKVLYFAALFICYKNVWVVFSFLLLFLLFFFVFFHFVYMHCSIGITQLISYLVSLSSVSIFIFSLLLLVLEKLSFPSQSRWITSRWRARWLCTRHHWQNEQKTKNRNQKQQTKEKKKKNT